MPLCLTLGVGDSLFLGKETLILKEVRGSTRYVITFRGEDFFIDKNDWALVAPGIEVRSPFAKNQLYPRVRVQINAPGLYISRHEPTNQQLKKGINYGLPSTAE